jgi:outer membrane protein assembly factor BamB
MMDRFSAWRIILVVCCGVFPAIETPSSGQIQPSIQNDIFLPAPRELKQHLTRARKAIDEEEYGEAVLHLGQLLTSEALNTPKGLAGEAQDFFIGLDGNTGTQVSLKAEAQRLLASMPLRGQQLYELQFGADARALLNEAIEQGETDKLTEVTRKYFHTRAGYQAAILLGRGEMDHGHPLAAAMCFKRVADTTLARDQFDPELSVLLATCWLQAQLPDAALKVLNDLKQRNPDVRVNVGGESLPLFAPGVELLTQLKAISKFSGQLANPDQLQWTMHRGTAGRTGTMVGGMPLKSLWWRVATAADNADEHLIEQLRQRDESDGAVSISQLQPLVVDNVVLMRGTGKLWAIDFQNGKRIWKFPWFDVSPEEIPIEPRFQRGQGANDSRSNQLRQRLWEDAAFGQLSSDGKKVFALADLSYANSNANYQQMMMFGPRGMAGGRGKKLKSTNRLVALDLATEGSLMWVVGGESGEDETRLAGAFFLGPPLPLYGQLYCLVEFNGEIRLVVLDSRNGELQWSQQLAHMEARTIMVDRKRRLAGASPSFSDGILVCPTSAGAVVAVDISSRSLLWGFQYPHIGSLSRSQLAQRRSTGNTSRQSGWIDATVTISGDSVLVTPVEGDQLICLDLINGTPRWGPLKRGNGLYIACVQDRLAVLVNEDSVTGISLANGDPAWAKPLELDGEMPSGRGFFSAGHYYLPTTGSRLLMIDVASGTLSESIPTDKPLGNLVCYKDHLISQTPDSVQSFFQLQPLRESVSKKLAANPSDTWALARKCELLLQDGDRLGALKTLRQSLLTSPDDVGLRALMVKTSLELLRADFPANRALTVELEKLLDHPSQRQQYLEILAVGLQQNGELAAAFDAYILLIDTLTVPIDVGTETFERLQRVEEDLQVRRDRWIQVKLAILREAANEDEQQRMDAVVLERYVLAVGSGRAQSLRDYLAYFGQHPSALSARMQLASRLIESNQAIERELLEAEIHLTHIQHSADKSLHGEAMARMALLLHKADRPVEAALAYQQLAARHSDEVVLEGSTGQQLLEEARRDATLLQQMDSIAWKPGNVIGPTVVNNRGQFPPFQRIYQMPLVELRGALPPTTMVALDQTRNQLVIRDAFGATLQQVSMNDGLRPVSSTQYAISYARANGHLLLLSLGPEIVAIDTIRNSQDPSEAILWRKHTTPPSSGDPRFAVNNMRTSSRMTPLGGRRYVAIDRQNRRLGITGSITANGIYYIKTEQLVCVDPLSGNEIWVRDNIPAGSDLYSNESVVVLVPPESNGEVEVYSAIDGHLLTTRPRPENETSWHHFGTDSVCYRLDGEHLHLLLRDQVTGDIHWQLTVPVGTRGQIVQRDELVLLQPDGSLQLVQLRSGEMTWSGKCEADPQLNSIHVSKSRDRFQVVTNHSANSSGISIPSMGMQAQLIYGKIYSVDAATGKQLWPSPATIEGWGLPLYQPAESPILVMLRQLNPRTVQNQNRGSIKSEFFCLDTRDGRLLMAPKQINGYIRSFNVLCSPKLQTVTVVINGEGHLFKLTDDELPPAAPVQMTIAKTTNSLGALGEQIKKALQGNNPFGPRIIGPARLPAAQKLGDPFAPKPKQVPVKPAVPPGEKPAPVPPANKPDDPGKKPAAPPKPAPP